MPRQTGRRSSRYSGSPLFSAAFFPAAILYHELIVRLFDQENPFFSMALLRILFFSVAAGLLVFLILDLLPWKKVSRFLGGAVLVFGTVYSCIEYCCKSFFKTYFGIGYMNQMAGEVVGDFFGTLVEVVAARIPFILLSFVPLVVYILLRRQVVYERGQAAAARILLAALLVLCQLLGFLLSNFGGAKSFYTYEFSANASIPHFGMFTCLRLETEYAVFGTPEEPMIDIPVDPIGTPTGAPTDEPTDTPTDTPTDEPTSTPIVYGYNALDIDFDGLAGAARDDTIKGLHQYFGSITPSQQNEYTGYFEGKNLILITAEAFSPYVISEELTPTLYRLSHEGFVFNNFYQPNWTQSTTGGEFAVMTGVIPTWIGGSLSFRVSADKAMPMALGWQFRELGYNVPAYHNNTYTYYGRDRTHPNLGYDYSGIGNGLELPSNLWPNSDLEMMQATIGGYIDDYVNNGTNFHAYYMTVSGHCNYNWGGNAMARKNRAAAEAAYPDASESVQAYIACNLELEYAMKYLVEQLEAAGIADDTVIVLTADHYPYAMAEGDVDYYNELTGLNDSERDTSRYRNTLILWCGSMEEPVVVDTPCSSIDILPTLANLFGLEYDSRLYSGRDVFATNYEVDQASTCMPLVVFANTGYGNSWITAAGTYEASTKTFTPNPGVEVDDNYVKTVSRLVQAKYSYAKLLIQHDYYSYVLPEPGA